MSRRTLVISGLHAALLLGAIALYAAYFFRPDGSTSTALQLARIHAHNKVTVRAIQTAQKRRDALLARPSGASKQDQQTMHQTKAPQLDLSPNILASHLLHDPEYSVLSRPFIEGFILQMHPDLLSGVTVAAEVRDKILNILVERFYGRSDVEGLMADSRREPASRDEFRRALEQVDAKSDDELRKLLDEKTFLRLMHNRATGDTRKLVDAMRVRLSYSEEPLSDERAASLVEMLVSSATALNISPPRLGADIGPAMLERVKPFVTERQLSTLGAIIEEHNSGRRRSELQAKLRQRTVTK